MANPWNRIPAHVTMRFDLGISRIQFLVEYRRTRRIVPTYIPTFACSTDRILLIAISTSLPDRGRWPNSRAPGFDDRLLEKNNAFQFFSYVFNLEEWASQGQFRNDTGVDRQIVSNPVT
jgi:hypothetical protein